MTSWYLNWFRWSSFSYHPLINVFLLSPCNQLHEFGHSLKMSFSKDTTYYFIWSKISTHAFRSKCVMCCEGHLKYNWVKSEISWQKINRLGPTEWRDRELRSWLKVFLNTCQISPISTGSDPNYFAQQPSLVDLVNTSSWRCSWDHRPNIWGSGSLGNREKNTTSLLWRMNSKIKWFTDFLKCLLPIS